MDETKKIDLKNTEVRELNRMLRKEMEIILIIST